MEDINLCLWHIWKWSILAVCYNTCTDLRVCQRRIYT